MDYELRFQDPSAAGTRYLYEEIIEQLLDTRSRVIEGIFAFASFNAAAGLTQDPAFTDYMARGYVVRLLVGLDAITDRRTLEVLRDASLKHAGRMEVRVYKNVQSGLFHPKLVRVIHEDGSGAVVVGSGNLTPGGFRNNIEAYCVLRYQAAVPVNQSDWDEFLVNHADEITEIDEDAFERGERNGERARLGRAIARRSGRAPRPAATTEELLGEEDGIVSVEDTGPQPDDRMLVAEVPAAGGRWHQVHFNEVAIRTYFRARPGTSDRVYLLRREPSGAVVPEPPRPVVFPPRNVNHRIEFGARPRDAYPTTGRPILVLREVGIRTHIYVMLFPGEPGYAEMSALLLSKPSIGPGVPRVLTTRANVSATWPGLPI